MTIVTLANTNDNINNNVHNINNNNSNCNANNDSINNNSNNNIISSSSNSNSNNNNSAVEGAQVLGLWRGALARPRHPALTAGLADICLLPYLLLVYVLFIHICIYY